MGQETKIEWTDHTFNHIRGCTKVSAGCTHCYADALSKRNPGTLGIWGKNGTREIASESMWAQPLKWNAAAQAAGERHRVFCASLADMFEGRDTMPESAWEAVEAARVRLFDLIRATPQLDWLLLTKRPENILPMLSAMRRIAVDYAAGRREGNNFAASHKFNPEQMGFMGGFCNAWLNGSPPHNVWIGTSIENQAAADERIPHLLKVPAVVRFLSMEPLLGPVDLTLGLEEFNAYDPMLNRKPSPIHWVIVGGESGNGARPCEVESVHSLVQQCRAAGVSSFVKQLGAHPQLDYYCEDDSIREWAFNERHSLVGWDESDGQPPTGTKIEIHLRDRKGGDIEVFPEDLRVREFPKVAVAA